MRNVLKYIVMALVLCMAASAMAQSTKWRDMYKVKKKDTIFGIAKQYGITMPELMEANPEMKVEGYELKKGDYIFIPFSKAAPATAATNTYGVSVPTVAKSQGKMIRVGV